MKLHFKATNMGRGAVLLCIVAIIVISVVVSMWLVPYNINTWLGWAGKAPVVKAWHGALIGLIPVVAEALIPISVITWVVGLFL